MKYYTGHSVKIDIKEALSEATGSFCARKPGLLLFFSDECRFAEFSKSLYELFPESSVVGCSTYGSFSETGFCRQGIRLMAFEGLDTSVGCIHEIKWHPMKYKKVVSEAVQRLGARSLQRENTCCFLLNPSGTDSEELVLDTLAEGLAGADIPVIGGTASSEKRTVGFVSFNGRVYEESSIFVLLHTEQGRIHILQDNLFQKTERCFTVTKVDVDKRTIYELDGHPVTEVLCRCLEVPFSQLDHALRSNPIARISGDNLFITEIEGVNPDGSIVTYCRIFNQSGIVLLKIGDIRKGIESKLEEVHAALPVLDFSLMVNCYSRTELFLQRGVMEAFTQMMGDSLGDYIGWSSHGEQRGVYHLNWTMLVVSFGGAR